MAVLAGMRGSVRAVVRSAVDALVLAGQAFPRTAEGLALRVGATPSHIFRHDQEAGNSVCDLTALELEPLGDITVGVLTKYGAGDRAVRCTSGSANRMQALANTVFDAAETSFAFLHVADFGLSPPLVARNWLGKIGTAFYTGRCLGGSVSFVAYDGTITRTAEIAANLFTNRFRCLIAGVDRDADEVVIALDGGAVTRTALDGLGSLSNTGFFTVGRTSGTSAPQIATYTARFAGAEAQALLANAPAAIAAFFQVPPL